MASRSGPLATPKRWPMSTQKDKAHRGNRKTSPRRKGSRIEKKQATEKGSTHQTDTKQQEEQPVGVNSSSRSLRHRTPNPIQKTSTFVQQAKTRKRRRGEDEDPASREPSHVKRARASAATVDRPVEPETVDSGQSYISHWARKKAWPRAYFEDDKMHHLLARKGSASSIGRKRSNPSLASFSASDERPREEKSAPYRNPSYPTFLSEDVANYKSYMEDHELGISDASEKLLETLLHTEQRPPTDTLFRDDVFSKHLRKLKGKNEPRVIQDLSPLLVPSAEALATFGAHHLDVVVESVNEGWNNCFPITKPRPQPDSAFGYGISAFSDHQLDKLRPTLGDASFSSFFNATYYMHFPFLTKEVKTGTMGLDIADNQNLHSITVAVRAVVELFKLVGREKELHREIVAFTISHDDKSVRLYAHYPYIDGDKITIWRRTVDQFYLDTKTKWRSYIFTTNVYNIFSPTHLKRICFAIDDISPGLTHSRPSETQNSESPQRLDDPISTSETSGLSQQLEQITPNTSVQTGPGSPQRKKTKKTKKTKDDNELVSGH